MPSWNKATWTLNTSVIKGWSLQNSSVSPFYLFYHQPSGRYVTLIFHEYNNLRCGHAQKVMALPRAQSHQDGIKSYYCDSSTVQGPTDRPHRLILQGSLCIFKGLNMHHILCLTIHTDQDRFVFFDQIYGKIPPLTAFPEFLR